MCDIPDLVKTREIVRYDDLEMEKKTKKQQRAKLKKKSIDCDHWIDLDHQRTSVTNRIDARIEHDAQFDPYETMMQAYQREKADDVSAPTCGAPSSDLVLSDMTHAALPRGKSSHRGNTATRNPDDGVHLVAPQFPDLPYPMLPPNYVCHICGQPGHWKSACPILAQQSTRSSGHKMQRIPEPTSTSAAAPDVDMATDGGSSKRVKLSVPPASYRCNLCKEAGHWIANCPLRSRERAIDRPPPGPGYVCRKCGVSGHWVELCPVRKSHFGDKGEAESKQLVVPSIESLEVGREVADALEEFEDEPRLLISRVVEILGEEKSRMLLVQTWQVEESGGLLRLDGSGLRRTAGGVYLWLVKQKLTRSEREKVWGGLPVT